MFELVFFGTSASAPSVQRGLSSALVSCNEHRFLIDCGEGTQRQLLRSGLGFRRLDRILLTHGHLDHILGLAGLASTFSRWEMIDQIEIYGGKWALDRVESLMGVVFGRYRPPIRVVLTDLEPSEPFDHPGTQQEHQKQCGQRRHHGAERDVSKHVEERELLGQGDEKIIEHGLNPPRPSGGTRRPEK